MMTRISFLLACVLLTSGLHGEGEVYRTWTDTQGRKLEATFRGIEGENVFLQIRNGYVHRLPLARLSAEDQEIAKKLKPEGLGIPADPNLAQAAARIDQLVDGALAKAGQKPNPLASESVLNFELAQGGDTRLDVYDAAGRRVASLLHSGLDPGRYSVRWNGHADNGSPPGAGLYFARLTAPGVRPHAVRLALAR